MSKKPQSPRNTLLGHVGTPGPLGGQFVDIWKADRNRFGIGQVLEWSSRSATHAGLLLASGERG